MGEPLVISVSGIRGVVGEALTPEIVAAYAAAHGAARRQATGTRAIVMGRDARVSGPMFAAAAEAGLRSAGCDVLDVGMACTPTILLAVENEGAAGGIAITASHNPARWNALKLASDKGMFLTPEAGLEVRSRVEEGRIPRAAWDSLGDRNDLPGATGRHVARVLDGPLVDREAIAARGFKIVLDACNGAGALPMVPLLEALGVAVVALHLEPTGRFPRDPEPTAVNLDELAALVAASGADLGFAIDPDGDRLALVDERGQTLGEDLTLALAVDYVLAERTRDDFPGPVVTNLSTSQVVDRAAEAHGRSVARTAVGEVNVALEMIASRSPIGGEGNGGVIDPGLHHTRDAPAGAALILSHLARSQRSLSEAAARFPSYAIRKVKLPLPEAGAAHIISRAESVFDDARQDRTDGLKLLWPEREEWLHLRASGTEPVIRAIAEAPDPDRAEALLDRVRELATGSPATYSH